MNTQLNIRFDENELTQMLNDSENASFVADVLFNENYTEYLNNLNKLSINFKHIKHTKLYELYERYNKQLEQEVVSEMLKWVYIHNGIFVYKHHDYQCLNFGENEFLFPFEDELYDDLDISFTNICSFKGAPTKLYGNLIAWDNNNKSKHFKDLKGLPSFIEGNLVLYGCTVDNWEGFPKYIGGLFKFPTMYDFDTFNRIDLKYNLSTSHIDSIDLRGSFLTTDINLPDIIPGDLYLPYKFKFTGKIKHIKGILYTYDWVLTPAEVDVFPTVSYLEYDFYENWDEPNFSSIFHKIENKIIKNWRLD